MRASAQPAVGAYENPNIRLSLAERVVFSIVGACLVIIVGVLIAVAAGV